MPDMKKCHNLPGLIIEFGLGMVNDKNGMMLLRKLN
jgi:hypothetical protein